MNHYITFKNHNIAIICKIASGIRFIICQSEIEKVFEIVLIINENGLLRNLTNLSLSLSLSILSFPCFSFLSFFIYNSITYVKHYNIRIKLLQYFVNYMTQRPRVNDRHSDQTRGLKCYKSISS